jgi:hypothetical protein
VKEKGVAVYDVDPTSPLKGLHRISVPQENRN